MRVIQICLNLIWMIKTPINHFRTWQALAYKETGSYICLLTENLYGYSSQKHVVPMTRPEVSGPGPVLQAMKSVKVVGCVSSGNQSQDHNALASGAKHSPQRQHRRQSRCRHYVATSCVIVSRCSRVKLSTCQASERAALQVQSSSTQLSQLSPPPVGVCNLNIMRCACARALHTIFGIFLALIHLIYHVE